MALEVELCVTSFRREQAPAAPPPDETDERGRWAGSRTTRAMLALHPAACQRTFDCANERRYYRPVKRRQGRGRRADGRRETVLTPAAFGDSFKRFLEAVTAGASDSAGPPIRRRLHAHFGLDPAGLPVVGESFPTSDHPNVQLAVDAFLDGDGRSAEVTGIAGTPPT